MPEIALHLDVLLVAVGAQALVALLPILIAQGVGIEVEHDVGGVERHGLAPGG